MLPLLVAVVIVVGITGADHPVRQDLLGDAVVLEEAIDGLLL